MKMGIHPFLKFLPLEGGGLRWGRNVEVRFIKPVFSFCKLATRNSQLATCILIGQLENRSIGELKNLFNFLPLSKTPTIWE
jgi:hypothetical protein